MDLFDKFLVILYYLVVVETWSSKQCSLITKLPHKNNGCVAADQEFQIRFNIARHRKVPSARAIKNMVRRFEETGSTKISNIRYQTEVLIVLITLTALK